MVPCFKVNRFVEVSRCVPLQAGGGKEEVAPNGGGGEGPHFLEIPGVPGYLAHKKTPTHLGPP